MISFSSFRFRFIFVFFLELAIAAFDERLSHICYCHIVRLTRHATLTYTPDFFDYCRHLRHFITPLLAAFIQIFLPAAPLLPPLRHHRLAFISAFTIDFLSHFRLSIFSPPADRRQLPISFIFLFFDIFTLIDITTLIFHFIYIVLSHFLELLSLFSISRFHIAFLFSDRRKYFSRHRA